MSERRRRGNAGRLHKHTAVDVDGPKFNVELRNRRTRWPGDILAPALWTCRGTAGNLTSCWTVIVTRGRSLGVFGPAGWLAGTGHVTPAQGCPAGSFQRGPRYLPL